MPEQRVLSFERRVSFSDAARPHPPSSRARQHMWASSHQPHASVPCDPGPPIARLWTSQPVCPNCPMSGILSRNGRSEWEASELATCSFGAWTNKPRQEAITASPLSGIQHPSDSCLLRMKQQLPIGNPCIAFPSLSASSPLWALARVLALCSRQRGRAFLESGHQLQRKLSHADSNQGTARQGEQECRTL
jgi:hypothetical protein